MRDAFNAIALIAENKIAEAVANGDFENLPGAGKPLPPDDMANVPPELRMAYKILKNADCLPPELERRKEIAALSDLLADCPDEKKRIAAMKRLRVLLEKTGANYASLEANDAYYQKILARLEHAERESK